MGLNHSPRIVTDGLVLCVDSANLKSYDKYENLVTYSQKFDEAIWNKNNCSVVQNDIVAPDGTLTAARITATVNDDVIVDNTYTATYNETPLTYSIFARAGTYRYIAIQSYVNIWSKTLVFDLQTGSPIAPFYPNDGRTWKIVPYPNGWYRCIVTYPANYYYYYRFRFALTNYVGPADAGIDSTTSPSVGQYIYVWGAQLEKGTTATDYYPTTASLKNRSTTILDLSGRSNNGTLTNGPLYNNDNGGSLVFDGVDDYVYLGQPSVQITPNRFSIDFVLYPINTDSIIVSPNSAGIDHFIRYDGVNQRINFQITETADVNNRARFSTINSVPLNTYTHLVCSIDNLTLKIYVNGVLDSTFVETITIANWSDFWHIGQRTNGTFRFNGRIPFFRVYNKELTNKEVLQNFNALKGRFGL